MASIDDRSIIADPVDLRPRPPASVVNLASFPQRPDGAAMVEYGPNGEERWLNAEQVAEQARADAARRDAQARLGWASQIADAQAFVKDANARRPALVAAVRAAEAKLTAEPIPDGVVIHAHGIWAASSAGNHAARRAMARDELTRAIYALESLDEHIEMYRAVERATRWNLNGKQPPTEDDAA